MAKIDPLSYHVKYTAYGVTIEMTFKDPEEDGISAEQKANDYIDAAIRCDPEGKATCVVTTEDSVIEVR